MTIFALSDHPETAAKREIIHKIGVTNLTVEKRIAGAQLQPTVMMAGVEIVATYQLAGLNRVALENVIHRIFGAARALLHNSVQRGFTSWIHAVRRGV